MQWAYPNPYEEEDYRNNYTPRDPRTQGYDPREICRVCMAPFLKSPFNPLMDICPHCDLAHQESLSHFQEEGESEVKVEPLFEFDMMRP